MTNNLFRQKLSQKGYSKILSLFLVLTLVFGSFGLMAGGQESVYGASSNAGVETAAKAALVKALNYYELDKNKVLTDWEEVLAIYATGKLPGQKLNLSSWTLPDTPTPTESVNSYLPAIVTSLIKGDNIGGLTSELAGKAKKGVFSDHADIQAQAMLALAIAERAGVSPGAGYNKKQAANYLVGLQTPQGGFSGEWDFGQTTIDTTGYVALALAAFANDKDFAGAITKLVAFLEDEQIETSGGFLGADYGFGRDESANSTALAVWGLSALKEATGNSALRVKISGMLGAALPALTKWQNPDGGFFSPYSEGGFDYFTSKQAMIALYQIGTGDNLYKQIESTVEDAISLQVVGFDGTSAYDIFKTGPVVFEKNDTAVSILDKAGLNVNQSGGYVSAIGGLVEKVHGPYSGWKVSINDSYIPYSAATYLLKDGDKIVWKYVRDPNEGEEAALAAGKFKDVSEDSWFAVPVGYLFNAGVFMGTSENQFSPDGDLTRAMLASLLARMSGADLSTYKASGFADVDMASWYGPAVAWAKDVGVVTGYAKKDGSFEFRPNNKISRQDIALMIYNYNDKVQNKDYEGVAKVNFVDESSIAEYAKTAVQAMQEAGIINGFKGKDGKYSYRPVENTSRAQAASLLHNVLTK